MCTRTNNFRLVDDEFMIMLLSGGILLEIGHQTADLYLVFLTHRFFTSLLRMEGSTMGSAIFELLTPEMKRYQFVDNVCSACAEVSFSPDSIFVNQFGCSATKQDAVGADQDTDAMLCSIGFLCWLKPSIIVGPAHCKVELFVKDLGKERISRKMLNS